MFGGWVELGRTFLAVCAVGATIKLVDDVLDADVDICLGQRTLAAKLRRSALPYCLVLVLLAAAANLQLTIAAYLGSYAVGMFAHLRERLPTHLPAYVETIAAVALMTVLTDWRTALWAIAIMCVIDWLDDVVDAVRDRECGQVNLAVRFGIVEVLVGVLIVFCAAVYANAVWTALVFIAMPILTIFFELTTTNLLTDDGGISS